MLTKSPSHKSKDTPVREIVSPRPVVRSNYMPWLVAAVFLLVIGLATAWYVPLYLAKKQTTLTPERMALNTDQVTSLVEKVALHIQVKEGEQPTVATIQDVEVLRAQNPDFYKDAKNGDRLLIWSDKAVLYSSTQDRLLAVLPIRISDTATTTSAPVTPPVPAAPKAPVVEQAVIDVRNGTQTVGLAKTVAGRLTSTGLKVGQVASAKASASTLIVVKAGASYPQTVEKLALLTGGKVAVLPAGEAAFSGDILLVIGSDY